MSRAARLLTARPLTAAGFAPFGAVLDTPAAAGARAYFDGALANLRPAAHASLSLIRAAPSLERPVPVRVIERHAFSSQSFVPMAPARWLVVAAPKGADGGPALDAAGAFLPAPGQGITFGPDVWHAPLTVLDAPAPFAILMWRDGGPQDEEVVRIPPLAVAV